MDKTIASCGTTTVGGSCRQPIELPVCTTRLSCPETQGDDAADVCARAQSTKEGRPGQDGERGGKAPESSPVCRVPLALWAERVEASPP